MTASVMVSDADGVRTISLCRPDRLNAINLDMIERVESALADAQKDDKVRVLLLRGSGRAFCAGDDVEAQTAISNQGEQALRDQLRKLQSISELLVLGTKPSLAAVQGWAVGAGFSWAINCDFQLWATGACGFFPEVGYGSFVTGGATHLLPRLVGPAYANQLLFQALRVTSGAALEHGLAHGVHPEIELDGRAAALVRELAQLPPRAAMAMKQALGGPISAPFRAALAEEIEQCVVTTLDPGTLARMRSAAGKG